MESAAQGFLGLTGLLLILVAFIVSVCIVVAPLLIWHWTKRTALALERIEKRLAGEGVSDEPETTSSGLTIRQP